MNKSSKALARRYLELLAAAVGPDGLAQVRALDDDPRHEAHNPEETLIDTGRLMRTAYVSLYGPDFEGEDVRAQVDLFFIPNRGLVKAAFYLARAAKWNSAHPELVDQPAA